MPAARRVCPSWPTTSTPPGRAEAEQAGAEVASGPADVAARSDVSLTMVMNDRVLREVALSEGGILGAAAPGHLYCDLSTVSPQVSADIAAAAEQRGVALPAGQGGRQHRARHRGPAHGLHIGRAEDAERAAPVLNAFAREVRHVGDGEAAHYLKLAHSIVVGAYAALIGEAVTFAAQGGVDYGTVVDVLEAGPLGLAPAVPQGPHAAGPHVLQPPVATSTPPPRTSTSR